MNQRASRILVIGSSLVLAALLLVAAWQFDLGLPHSQRQRTTPIEELVAPRPLSDAERAAAQSRASGTTVQLEHGAWVQVAGKDGRVAQQYAAQRIDPQPGAFMGMTEPRTVFYFDDGRVATLRANSGRVHVPNRALESGTFDGDVVIRLYRPSGPTPVNLAKDSPALILESQQLEFDQVLGTIGCQTAFRLTTDMLTFDGEGLDLLLGRDGKSIERMTVANPLGPIVIDRSRHQGERLSSSARVAEMTPVSYRPWKNEESPQAPVSPKPVATETAKAPENRAVIAPSAERFYRLELHDDVEVLRYSPRDRAWTKGDLLVAIFTLKSDLVARDMVMQSAPVETAPPAAAFHSSRPPQMGILAHLASAVTAVSTGAANQGAEGDLLVVRFTGQLLLEPAAVDEQVPSRPQDMRVQIDGKDVEMANHTGMALRAHEIDLDLIRDADGRTTPQLLVAKGAVEATDIAQTIWCDGLRAEFVSTPLANQSDAQAGAALGSAEVARVTATDGVQLQLKDGARVFAREMIALPPQGSADLKGPDISIVRSGVLIEGLTELAVNEPTRSAHSPSGGRTRSWTQPLVAPDSRGKIALPAAPSSKPELDAKWSGKMAFVDRAQAGATLDLTREVHVRAEPRPNEFDALDADHVHLEFERRSAEGETLATRAAAPPGAVGSDVRARRLVATGDARIENLVWASDERTGEPRLFQLRGQAIEYDALTGEAVVPGAGSVLVNVPSGGGREAHTAQNRGRDQKIAGGGVEGVSRFRWAKAMNLKRMVDSRYLMTMDQSVELVRAGPQQLDTMSLTCDRLEATLERSKSDSDDAVATSASAGSANANSSFNSNFNLGGSSELQRVRGVGRCFIRTPRYDVECEEFDYNVVTQIAELRARPGRLVNVLPKGQGTPLRAAAMTWDLASGKIQIRAGSGAVGQ
ncbi:MAG: hypothetical protein EXS17_08575 [Phycisphaerales bacterium]|nr:hypothetical protein [Phycisphaerales bacterium]